MRFFFFLRKAFITINICLRTAFAVSYGKDAEVEWFYEDLQDLQELTPQKYFLFIIGNRNAKVGSQEITGVTGKFGLGVQNEAGQRLIEFCQEKAPVIAPVTSSSNNKR